MYTHIPIHTYIYIYTHIYVSGGQAGKEAMWYMKCGQCARVSAQKNTMKFRKSTVHFGTERFEQLLELPAGERLRMSRSPKGRKAHRGPHGWPLRRRSAPSPADYIYIYIYIYIYRERERCVCDNDNNNDNDDH